MIGRMRLLIEFSTYETGDKQELYETGADVLIIMGSEFHESLHGG